MRVPPGAAARLLPVVAGWTAALAVVTRWPGDPLRAAVAGAFLLAGLGTAVLQAARPLGDRPGPADRLLTAALAPVAGAAVVALAAVALFSAHAFTAVRLTTGLALLTTLLALLPRPRPPRQEPARPDPPGGGPAAAPRRPPRPGRTALRVATTAALCLLLTTACSGIPDGPGASPGAQAVSGGRTEPARDRPAAPGPWHLVFHDDFTGPALNTADWATCYDWNDHGCTNAGNGEEQWYLPGGVSVADGALALTARRQDTRGSDGRTYPWTSGMVTTGRDHWDGAPRHTFTYGYFAAAIRAPADALGMFPAFWLIPAEARGTPPELDVAEFPNTNLQVDMNLHWRAADGRDAHVGHRDGPADFAAEYHVFALDWEPDAVTWYVDGVERFRITESARIPSVAMEIVVNLAVGYLVSPPASLDTSTLKVDWVAVWQH
ncbi:hypothetical protein KNE206_00620 [Kitasatospora sp. NE20-6]|uniref:glycoside hydrolase family 16 protein n=1 Tax=Kitasatospora sp. NE20-6 TaxID=2859066 RepID=UPI0034DCA628